MALFAIADLHLGLSVDKPMDIFGNNWKNHTEKIRQNWISEITDDDTVIIGGDISWAMTLDEAEKDMLFIKDLPGRKIVLQGNHDYWWDSAKKINTKYPFLTVLRNNFIDYKNTAICGARGWVCPNDTKFDKDDEKKYAREQIRLRNSIESAVKEGYDKIIVVMHYPPMNEKNESSAFTDIIDQFSQVKKVIYGHIHGKDAFDDVFVGKRNNKDYILVSADYLDFVPLKIEE